MAEAPSGKVIGSVSQLLAKHSVQVRRGRVDINRDQGIVERFNRTLAKRLFGLQYAQEMRLPSGERSTEWVKRLPSVVAVLNEEVTRLSSKKPSNVIKALLASKSRPTYSAISRPAHSSFNFPRTFLLAELYRRWSWG